MAAPVVQFASISPWLWQTGWNAPDAIINGNVLGGPGTDTLVLGGEGTGSFNVGAIGLGLQYQSFEIFLKEGGSHWTLTGTTAAVTPWTINQGTLAISSDANLAQPPSGEPRLRRRHAAGARKLHQQSRGRAERRRRISGTDGDIATLAGAIGGGGGLNKIGTGTPMLTVPTPIPAPPPSMPARSWSTARSPTRR